MSVRPYAILEMYNSKGELIYSHDRDEPAPIQVVSRKVVEQMNTMMLAVVTNGTATKAQLDFATVAGKTGTSSSYRDAWFVGFTGALVTGVWVGYDDFRPMPGVTGGSLPTQAWHSYMQVAMRNYRSIPTIPGLAPHPNQVVEPPRQMEVARSPTDQGQTTQRKSSLMPDQTRAVLKKLADGMRVAAGLAPTPPGAPPSPPAPAGATPPPPAPATPKAKAAPSPPERRAQAPEAAERQPR